MDEQDIKFYCRSVDQHFTRCITGNPLAPTRNARMSINSSQQRDEHGAHLEVPIANACRTYGSHSLHSHTDAMNMDAMNDP